MKSRTPSPPSPVDRRALAKPTGLQRRTRDSTWLRGQRQHDILDFAVTWAPYGGGDSADIFVRFGISVRRYLALLEIVLMGPEGDSLSAEQRRLVEEMISQRRLR